MNSEEIHLKSCSNKIQEKKCTKCFYVHKHSEAILQAFLWHYNIMTMAFFFVCCFFLAFDYVQLIKHHSLTQCNNRLHNIAQEISIHEKYIIRKLGEDIHSTQAISFRINFIQLECVMWSNAHGEKYYNIKLYTNSVTQ